MRKRVAIYMLLVFFFFTGLVSAAEEKKEKFKNLNHWQGKSISIINLYKGEAGDRFFSEVTKYAPKGYTKKMVKDYIYKIFSLKFSSLNVVDEDTIVLDSKISGDYKYTGTLTTTWEGHETTWNIFKTDSKEMIQEGFKYFLFMPFHQHGKDSLRHTHLRYGNENFDFLVTDPSLHSWWPTVYQPAVTDEAGVIESMIKKARLQASMLPPLKKTVNK